MLEAREAITNNQRRQASVGKQRAQHWIKSAQHQGPNKQTQESEDGGARRGATSKVPRLATDRHASLATYGPAQVRQARLIFSQRLGWPEFVAHFPAKSC